MPTENRSSNTEMVSVPREPLRQFIEYSASVCKSPAWVKDKAALLTALEQPAPQPHPEPIAWMVGTAIWWTKEEAERDAVATGLPMFPFGPLTGASPADQHQGEPVALPARKAHKKGNSPMQNAKNSAWNACLDEIAKLGPLYARADPGEVERLRAELEQFKIANARLSMSNVDRRNQNAELSAQLAERDALLRDLEGKTILSWPDKRRISAALSASAEPSACEHDWIDARNQFVQSGELCIKCHAIRAGNVTLERKPS